MTVNLFGYCTTVVRAFWLGLERSYG